MTAKGFFRMAKLRGPRKVLIASRHNKRALQAESGAARHIDAGRSHLNLCLHGPATPDAVAALARDLMAKCGITRHRAKGIVALELLFSLPRATEIDHANYFPECVKWAAANFGGIDNVLSADVHLDEAAPHMHVLILPLVNGRMNGSDLFGNRQRLLDLQDGFHAAVSGRYGLSKAGPALRGQEKESAALAVVQQLRAANDPAQASVVWPIIKNAIDDDPVPFAEYLGIDLAALLRKPMRTMAQVFTSTGKGPRGRSEPIGKFANPIAKGAGPPCDVTLSCVGDATFTSMDDGEAPTGTGVSTLMRASVTRKPINSEPEPDAGDDARVVDRDDCDFAGWAD